MSLKHEYKGILKQNQHLQSSKASNRAPGKDNDFSRNFDDDVNECALMLYVYPKLPKYYGNYLLVLESILGGLEKKYI